MMRREKENVLRLPEIVINERKNDIFSHSYSHWMEWNIDIVLLPLERVINERKNGSFRLFLTKILT